MSKQDYTHHDYNESEEMNLAEIVSRFLNGFSKFWWLSVILAIALGSYGYSKTIKQYVPYYESKATLTITAAEYDGTDASYTNNSQLASQLGVSFGYLINNEVFYETLKKDLGVSRLTGKINVSVLEDTNILSISVIGPVAEDNYHILQSVMKNYSSVAEFVLGDTTLKVLEEPLLSTAPINPLDWKRNAVLFSMIGFLLGTLPAILYAFFIKTIRNKDEIEELLNLHCFGELPEVNFKVKKGEIKSHSILNRKVGFKYLEDVRKVTSRCEREFTHTDKKVILVTSTVSGEGKSTFAMNLSYSLSKLGHKVVLIDGDLRKPSLRKLTQTQGISYNMGDFVSGKISISDAIISLKGTRVVLLAGDKPTADPIEVLNSKRMNQVIKQCREVAEYVIIDAQPCSSLADAAVLAKYSDAAVYIIRQDCAKVNTIFDAIQQLSYTRIPILGSVFNMASSGIGKDYGYYGYGYGNYRRGYRYYGNEVESEIIESNEFSAKGRSTSDKIRRR